MSDAAHLLGTLIDAFNSRDAAAAAALVAEDVAHDPVGGARAMGRDAFRLALGRRFHERDETLGDVVVMSGQGGSRAAAEFTLRGRGADGRARSVNAGMFAEADGGRLVRLTEYARPAD